MRIYLGVCCLNRPFDDQIQDKIHLEAVLMILSNVIFGEWSIVSSEVVDMEISKTPDSDRRKKVKNQLPDYDIKVDNPVKWLMEVLK